jgi:hypothetical protein
MRKPNYVFINAALFATILSLGALAGCDTGLIQVPPSACEADPTLMCQSPWAEPPKPNPDLPTDVIAK